MALAGDVRRRPYRIASAREARAACRPSQRNACPLAKRPPPRQGGGAECSQQATRRPPRPLHNAGLAHGPRARAAQESFEMGSNGAVTMLSKSITPYQFSSEGMIKAASRQQPQHHYRVRPPPRAEGPLGSRGVAGVGECQVLACGKGQPCGFCRRGFHLGRRPRQLPSPRAQLRASLLPSHDAHPQVSERDIFVIKTLGRGASSVVGVGAGARAGAPPGGRWGAPAAAAAL